MVNKVILVGRLGKDPEIRSFENGAKVANFSLATSESYKKDNEKVEKTEWHNVSLWRGLADVAERFLKKGDMIYVEGKLRTRAWDDNNGNKRYTTEVMADNMTMLGKKGDNQDSPAPNNAPQNTQNESNMSAEPQGDDDLPF